jgi:short-subunit dehydrogenase
VIGPFHQRGRRPGAEICATEPLTVLVNNAGVAHYMPLADLPAGKAAELVNVKALAGARLKPASLPGH